MVERYINRLFPQWGIRFLSLVDNADSANEDNLLLRQINGIMDEHYLAELSKNIRSVLTHRRKNGFHIRHPLRSMATERIPIRGDSAD